MFRLIPLHRRRPAATGRRAVSDRAAHERQPAAVVLALRGGSMIVITSTASCAVTGNGAPSRIDAASAR